MGATGVDDGPGELPVSDATLEGGGAMKRMFVLLMLAGWAGSATLAERGGELTFCVYSEPKTFNPLLVADTSSELIRYMTAGALIRVNRQTQELEPELALSWRVTLQGRRIAFKL